MEGEVSSSRGHPPSHLVAGGHDRVPTSGSPSERVCDLCTPIMNDKTRLLEYSKGT